MQSIGSDTQFAAQIAGYGLTTAHILYRMPDHRTLLQTYVWQNYDLAPHVPELEKFLAFWRDRLDGPLHSVEVAHKVLVGAAEWRAAKAMLKLH